MDGEGKGTIMKKRYSKWFSIDECVNCGEYLTDSEVMYSKGTCPKCGHKGLDAVTIVDTNTRVCRIVSDHPWWMFWKKSTLEYKSSFMGDNK